MFHRQLTTVWLSAVNVEPPFIRLVSASEGGHRAKALVQVLQQLVSLSSAQQVRTKGKEPQVVLNDRDLSWWV